MAYKPQVLPVTAGGTALATLTAHALYAGNGTSAPTALAVGTTGTCLIGQTGADPVWGAPATSPAVGVINLGFTYAASTFTITAEDQSALSATNFGYVTIPSALTPGKTLRFKITSGKSFIDDTGASNILGAIMGCTLNVDWTSNMPIYLYAVANAAETECNFAIARMPNILSAIAAAHLGQKGATAGADGNSSFFFLDSGLTLADWVGGACICIGSFRMKKTSGAANDWTVTALESLDGIGKFQEGVQFLFPVAQFGAAANTHWIPNGGTAPIFTAKNYYYHINKSGLLTADVDQQNVSSAGVGAVVAFMTCPFPTNYSGSQSISGWAYGPATSIFVGQYNGSFANIIQYVSGVTSCSNANFSLGTYMVGGYVLNIH